MECEFCGAIGGGTNDGDPVVYPYVVAEDIVFCCGECLETKIPSDDRYPIMLPDGWEVVPSKELNVYRQQKQALVAVSDELRIADGLEPSGTYYAYPAGRLKDLFCRLNARTDSYDKSLSRLGLASDVLPELSGAYCPACKGPLIKMVGLKQRHALKCASSDLVNVMKPTQKKRNREVWACLQCCTAYIGGK